MKTINNHCLLTPQTDYVIREIIKKETHQKLETILQAIDVNEEFNPIITVHLYKEYVQTMSLAEGLFQPLTTQVYWYELMIRSYQA